MTERAMLVEHMRAKRQLDHEINIKVMQWTLGEIRDVELTAGCGSALHKYMERLAPFMDKEPGQ